MKSAPSRLADLLSLRGASPAVVSARLVRLIELIALLSLFATREVHPAAFAVAVVAAPLTWALTRLREIPGGVRGILPDRVLLVLMLSLLIAAAVIARKAGWHPVLVVSYGAPLMHSILWFGAPSARGRSWRIGMAFVELVLAMAISADLYLAAVFFLFVVISSLALSTGFLDREFAEHDSKLRGRPLPGYFYTSSVAVAVMVLLASILLFPLLPKPREGGFGWGLGGGATPGYTETVDLADGAQWEQGGRDPTAVRIFLPAASDSGEPGDAREWIPRGLLRSRTLGRFDGKSWQPFDSRGPRDDGKRAGIPPREWKLTIRREALRTPYLPVPYGTLDASISDGRPWSLLARNRAGEWTYSAAWLHPVNYQVRLRRELYQDPPVAVHLALPKAWSGSDRALRELAGRIFAEARTPAEKIEALIRHFATSGFTAAFLDEAADEQDALHAIERFLLETRSGHCEYFASAAAVLLRMGGVPTRLVAGFRVTRQAIGGVLSLRQSDAHAWVEAWDPASGWRVIDPTPLQLVESVSFWVMLQDVQDLLAAYWYRYVVALDESEAAATDTALQLLWDDVRTWAGPQGPWKWDLLALVMMSLPGLGLIAAVLLLLRRRSAQGRVSREGPLYTESRARRFDLKLRLLRWHWLTRRNSEFTDGIEREWMAALQWLRYGRVKPGSREWKNGLRHLDSLIHQARRS